jgi:hypothetical protein
MEREEQLELRMKRRQLSHAYLVAGENREELAKRLATAWVCTGAEPPCGACAGCRKASRALQEDQKTKGPRSNQGIHPDVVWYDQAGEGLKAEEARALRADAYITPNEAEQKVYVLAHGEKLNAAAQNILLKLVEEGPEKARFLFLAPNPEMMLETIRSRCETLWAPGEETAQASQDGATLTKYLTTRAGPVETLPFLVGLEKKTRGEITLLLDDVIGRLTAALPQRPELLAVLDKVAPIRAACEFNISSGHLSGWIMSIL